jgi:cytochrome c5
MRVRRPLGALPLAALALAVAGMLLSGGCASIPLPEREGVVLYRAKCSGCHRPYAPQEIDAAGWEKRLPEMARRAKLTPDEYETIRRYVLVTEVGMLPSHTPR